MTRYYLLLLLLVFSTLVSCKKEEKTEPDPPSGSETKDLTIFTVNDVHAQLYNFSKIKYIADEEAQNTNVLLVCGGDIFSGNPIVDNYAEKGFPLIDVMNQTGFDVVTLGNHEFDYGVEALGDRIAQSGFIWVCSNLEQYPGLDHSLYGTIEVDEMRVTFIGLVETNGKPGAFIPSTHPWKVEELSFFNYQSIVPQYNDLKEAEGADLYVALTHLGDWEDYELALNYPYFDMIIGGHSHQLVDTIVNGIPIFQAGSYLNYLGKITLEIENKEIKDVDYEVIDLNAYNQYDAGLQQLIQQYESSMPSLDEEIGYSSDYYSKYTGLGCFYTDAMRIQMGVDVNFQNSGGLRNVLDEGPITAREIYAISPFNNGTIIYNMTVAEIKTFLKECGSGFFFSGILLEQEGAEVVIKSESGDILPDTHILSLGINDYIPAVYDMYFPPLSSASVQEYTDAETIIMYLENLTQPVEYDGCVRWFRYTN